MKHLVRSLGRARGYAVVAIASLALGIAGVTVVFSVLRALLLAPLPYARPEDLVLVSPHPLPQVFEAWLKDNVVFDGLAGYNERAVNCSDGVEPQRILMGRVTDTFFSVTRVHVAVGRVFAADDFQPGHEQVVLVTDRFWRRQFAASPEVLGRTISLDDRPYTIVGVLPPAFRAPTDLASGRELSTSWGAAVLVPLVGNPLARDPTATDRFWRGLVAIGRLRPDVTPARAQSDLAVIAGRVPVPSPRLRFDYRVIRLTDYASADVPRQLAILGAAVGLLLLVACANVASLVLARGVSRRSELGTRLAIGASRAHLVRQTLGETLALGLAGGAAGVLLAWAGTRVVASLGGVVLSRLDTVAIDPLVLAFSAVTSIGTGLLVGLAPALSLSRVDPLVTLRGERRSDAGRRSRLLSALVALEVALSLVLLVGAALIARELGRQVSVDLGFRTADTLTADLSLSRTKYAGAPALTAFVSDLLDRAAAIPGVESAAIGTTVPASGSSSSTHVTVDQATLAAAPGAPDDPFASFSLSESVAGDYFRVLSIPIVAGRPLDGRDTAAGQRAVVVNEAFAKKYWGGAAAALGHKVLSDDVAFDIVGVAGNIGAPGRTSPVLPLVYFSYLQDPAPSSQMTVFLHGRNAAALAIPLGDVVRAISPGQPLFDVSTLERIVFSSLARLRLIGLMIAVFGALTIALAAVGVYGTTTFSVAQRMHEMGVRLALGGSPRRLFGLVVRDGMKTVVVGAMIGLPLARAFTGLMASRLEGVGAADAATFAVSFLFVAGIGLVGCAIPAVRAMLADPREILRTQ